MEPAHHDAPVAARLAWLDIIRGISILWIVFFHFFNAWVNRRFPWILVKHYLATFVARCAPTSALGTAECYGKGLFVGAVQVGFHAVGVFVVLSGFGLTYSLAKTGNPEAGWSGWYRARVIRLYPMYWLAHLIYLVSPFVSRPEPIDYRFLLSFVGDRIYPMDMIFYYFNPALWYFGLLLEFYLVFPVLFRLMQRVGPGWFLALCALETILSRYLLLAVFRVDGNWVQGGFFGCRLWEFAAGMVAGLYFRRHAVESERLLFTWRALVAALVIYTLGFYSYGSFVTYTVTDAFTGIGLTLILAHVAYWILKLPRAAVRLADVGTYSYGLYLLHQPYVLYVGARVRWLGLPGFVALACVTIAIITLGAMWLEQHVNELTNRVLGPARKPVVQAAAS